MNNEKTNHKSKALAFILSALPGAGHMYIGMSRQGTQFMLLFLSMIFIVNWLDMEAIAIFIPVVWFSSLFDCLKKVSMADLPEDVDIPFVSWLKKDIHFSSNKTKNIGYILIILGIYLLIDNTIIPQFNIIMSNQLRAMIKTTIVSLLLIGGGIKLIWNTKNSIIKKEMED